MRAAFQSGAAAERFDRMVAALGGPTGFLESFDDHLDTAERTDEVTAGADGFVTAIDTRALGLAVVELGGGRSRASDPIHYGVGLEHLIGLGAAVEPDTPLALVHAADDAALGAAKARVRAAYIIGPEPPEPTPLIVERVS
jgi:thymidine phosphorylase